MYSSLSWLRFLVLFRQNEQLSHEEGTTDQTTKNTLYKGMDVRTHTALIPMTGLSTTSE